MDARVLRTCADSEWHHNPQRHAASVNLDAALAFARTANRIASHVSRPRHRCRRRTCRGAARKGDDDALLKKAWTEGARNSHQAISRASFISGLHYKDVVLYRKEPRVHKNMLNQRLRQYGGVGSARPDFFSRTVPRRVQTQFDVYGQSPPSTNCSYTCPVANRHDSNPSAMLWRPASSWTPPWRLLAVRPRRDGMIDQSIYVIYAARGDRQPTRLRHRVAPLGDHKQLPGIRRRTIRTLLLLQ